MAKCLYTYSCAPACVQTQKQEHRIVLSDMTIVE